MMAARLPGVRAPRFAFYPLSALGLLASAGWAVRDGAPLLLLGHLALTLSVVAVHELGHVSLARFAGYRARINVLTPIYGRTGIHSLSRGAQPKPLRFFLLAVAGPMAGGMAALLAAMLLPSLASPLFGLPPAALRLFALLSALDNHEVKELAGPLPPGPPHSDGEARGRGGVKRDVDGEP